MEAVVKNGVALVTTEGCIVGDYSFSKMQAEGLKKANTVIH